MRPEGELWMTEKKQLRLPTLRTDKDGEGDRFQYCGYFKLGWEPK
jgi:hypothetical protein